MRGRERAARLWKQGWQGPGAVMSRLAVGGGHLPVPAAAPGFAGSWGWGAVLSRSPSLELQVSSGVQPVGVSADSASLLDLTLSSSMQGPAWAWPACDLVGLSPYTSASTPACLLWALAHAAQGQGQGKRKQHLHDPNSSTEDPKQGRAYSDMKEGPVPFTHVADGWVGSSMDERVKQWPLGSQRCRCQLLRLRGPNTHAGSSWPPPAG